MRLPIAVLLILPSFAFAERYRLDFELALKDGQPMRGSMILDGETEGSMTIANRTIRFVPTPAGPDTVKISSVIMEGNRRIASPTVVARLDQDAQISETDRTGKTSLRLKWKPTLVAKP